MSTARGDDHYGSSRLSGAPPRELCRKAAQAEASWVCPTVHTVTLEHQTSKAQRTVQLLKVWEYTAQIWWPLCGAHMVEVRGKDAGRMWSQSGVMSQWRLIPTDLRRLRRRRPVALYDPGVRDEE